VFVKYNNDSFYEKILCVAEAFASRRIFGYSGQKHLPGVGNTDDRVNFHVHRKNKEKKMQNNDRLATLLYILGLEMSFLWACRLFFEHATV
jgi:hypothetical protein